MTKNDAYLSPGACQFFDNQFSVAGEKLALAISAISTRFALKTIV